MASLNFAGGVYNLVNKPRRESPRQDTKSYMVGKALVIGWLYPPGSRHRSKNNTPVDLTERYWD